MASLAVLIRSAPYGTLEAAEGVRHLAGREALGFEEVVGLFCDEGVWALARGQRAAPGFTSLEPTLEKLASEGVPLLAERGSLAERSLGREDLLPGTQLVEPIERQLFDADVVLVF
jgi:sulfur relay (sulfurtransferase) DsrF/TusC family protein